MKELKLLASIILGCLANFVGQYGTIILLVAVAIAFDWATGLVRANYTNTVNSCKGYKGIMRKTGLLLALFFAIFIDFFIPILSSVIIGFTLPFNTPFGAVMGVIIIVNECVSICENLYQTSVPMPKIIIKMFKTAQEQLNNKED